MARRALLVGCNYPGSEAPLNGCVNDVMSMQSLLVECFGFDPSDITIMVDTDESTPTPTGANIKHALLEHVTACEPGDVLVFHFSGHGTQVPDDNEERDGMDEALYPVDGNVLTDDDLRDIVAQLPEGVKFTMISDCCHSGSMLDHPEQQISGEKAESEAEPVTDFSNRSIEPDMFMQLLGAQAGVDIGRGNIRSTMRDLFGDEASSKAKSWAGFLEMFAQDESVEPPYIPGHKAENLLDAEKGILITGCQASETSADATIADMPCGALTNGIVTVVRSIKEQDPEAEITYVDLVRDVRAHLLQGGFAQNPCLECSDSNATTTFII